MNGVGSAPEAGSSSGAFAAASAFAAAALIAATRRKSAVARQGTEGGNTSWSGHQWDRKWWHIEETRDPTTLPLWQRDTSYGYRLLTRTMIEGRKRAEKVFWDCRVVKSFENGCRIEMLASGLLGFVLVSQEGPERLKVGEVYKFECLSCPTVRHAKPGKYNVWPVEPRVFKKLPSFSHAQYLWHQENIKKAQEVIAGDIVTGWVYKLVNKGIIINLEKPGPDGPKGFMYMHDISRKMSHHKWVEKMWPEGTKLKLYVIHSDHKNGRITLGTKEFEDDAHMGWVISFPERMMKHAEEGVRLYHEKRDAYIWKLQK